MGPSTASSEGREVKRHGDGVARDLWRQQCRQLSLVFQNPVKMIRYGVRSQYCKHQDAGVV